MATSWLEYIKTILVKVSFDAALFEKELRKALTQLVSGDIRKLRRWCFAQFGKVYGVILKRCFSLHRLRAMPIFVRS